ncbi:MAG: DNA glycosylase [Prosthecochloris sp.]|nr:DNA glycosylase [Prosthecochloris sp.]
MKSDTIHSRNDIDLNNSIFSGQTFRWTNLEWDHQKYISIIDGNVVIVEQETPSSLRILSQPVQNQNEISRDRLNDYFSLDIDPLECFPLSFRTRYPELWQLLLPYRGIRVLRQDAFETLVTFMCAQGIGMHIIRRQIDTICSRFGRKHTIEVNGKPVSFFSFPSAETLAGADPAELKICTNNNCLRASNIISAARAVSSGSLELNALADPSRNLEEIRETLCGLKGVGLKIADCVMLFGLHRFDAFPVDTHVHQYLGHWFSLPGALKSLSRKTYLTLQKEALDILSPRYAGFAGHLLFHCWRRDIRHMTSF